MLSKFHIFIQDNVYVYLSTHVSAYCIVPVRVVKIARFFNWLTVSKKTG